jgi:hypothetical protein
MHQEEKGTILSFKDAIKKYRTTPSTQEGSCARDKHYLEVVERENSNFFSNETGQKDISKKIIQQTEAEIKENKMRIEATKAKIKESEMRIEAEIAKTKLETEKNDNKIAILGQETNNTYQDQEIKENEDKEERLENQDEGYCESTVDAIREILSSCDKNSKLISPEHIWDIVVCQQGDIKKTIKTVKKELLTYSIMILSDIAISFQNKKQELKKYESKIVVPREETPEDLTAETAAKTIEKLGGCREEIKTGVIMVMYCKKEDNYWIPVKSEEFSKIEEENKKRFVIGGIHSQHKNSKGELAFIKNVKDFIKSHIAFR